MVTDNELLYDVNRTYEDNYRYGPFGVFGEVLTQDATLSVNSDEQLLSQSDVADMPVHIEPLSIDVRKPFGIPAGPLLNERFTTAAFRLGYDIVAYKTVRSRAWDCNPFPNVLAVHVTNPDGKLIPNSQDTEEGLLADSHYEDPIAISNSFGVPSQDPDVWQPDMHNAVTKAGKGQVLLASFQGSHTADMDRMAYIQDHVDTAKLVVETGATLLEMNTSCPNEGNNRLLCHDPQLIGEITEAIKNAIGDIPLCIKLAYMPHDNDERMLKTMLEHTVSRGTVQGISAINTISAKLVDEQGNQALPGVGRERSGVCGKPIRHAGLNMVSRLAQLRATNDYGDFSIVGVGGVCTAEDFFAYRKAGADVVMSATGVMWNPYLAQDIAQELSIKNYPC